MKELIEPTSFRIDDGLEYLRLSTPGPNDHIRSVFPLVLVSVGSAISIGSGGNDSGEARATIATSSHTGSSFSVAKDSNAVSGLVNVFGVPCRGGSVRVVDAGLEFQSGTEILLKQ